MVFGFGLFGAIKSDHPVQNAMGSVGRAVLSTWFLTMKWSDIGRDELLLIRALRQDAEAHRGRISSASSNRTQQTTNKPTEGHNRHQDKQVAEICPSNSVLCDLL